MLSVNVEVIFIVTVCSKILFVNTEISNSPVPEFKLIIEELEIGFVPDESYRPYESSQFEGNDVTGENCETVNTF